MKIKFNKNCKKALLFSLICIQATLFSVPKVNIQAATGRQMETLDRGMVAVKITNGVFVSWRIFGTEASTVTYNLYRDSTKIASNLNVSNYTDTSGTTGSTYSVAAVVNGVEQAKSAATSILSNNYLPINITPPDGGTTPDGVAYTYNANDCSVADLDGDHQYEIILKWDPSNSQDNSKKGYTGNTYIDAYKLNSTRLWRIDLGKNIRSGAHYTQFMAYDLNGDGKAEVACKTSDGSKDGLGTVIKDGTKDYRNADGYILTGNEYLTVFQGSNGKALYTTNYDPPRGTNLKADWGDDYGNRVDRFLACVAYLDGVHPSLVMCRGYYTQCNLVAYDWNGSTLTKRWTFSSTQAGNLAYAGQGNHNLSVADVDGDGKDEITYGACAIDDNGKPLYTTGLGHGDALHLGDLDPNRAGLEVFQVHESVGPKAEEMRDAKTGAIIWAKPITSDVGRAMSAHIDPRYKGDQMWINTTPPTNTPVNGLFDCKGNQISTTNPGSANFAVWWDGDLMRELLDHNWNATTAQGTPVIKKWDYTNSKLTDLATFNDCYSNNYTKGNPCLSGDILGDWREEVILRTTDNKQLRIYTTTAPTTTRMYTLMHDPVYRLGIAWQNVAYNQPPHLGFYFGTGMSTPPTPNIYLAP
jgi:rhamnogalacturonan endolyase